MLVAKNFISYNYYLWAKSKGVKVFLFNEIDFIPDESEGSGEIFFNCTSYRVESTWYTWTENEKLIQSFKIKFPSLFKIKNYDITLAVQKAMYWANFKSGFLWYCIVNFFPNEKIFYADSLHQSGKLGAIGRYFKLVEFKRKNKIKKIVEKRSEFKFAIHLKSDFQLGFYIDLIEKTKHDKQFSLFIEPKVNEQYLKELGIADFHKIQHSDKIYPVPLINPFKLSKKDSFTLNIILIHWKEINENIQSAEAICHTGLKATLINEGENGIYGAIVSEVFNKNGVKVYNTMNGVKSGEAQDAFINFDYWFVWDTQMKEMLATTNNISRDKLIISGHLIQDLIQNYQYHNSLNVNLESLKSKKVISIFTVKGKRFAKLESLKFLYNLLEEDESIELFIRPHPAEKPEDYVLPEIDHERVHLANYNSKNLNSSLHDLLLISDLAIVYGSTVALDAKWMGVPCITFEIREKSMIYCADNDKIKHVRTLEDFITLVKSSLSKKQNNIDANKSSVSDFILEEIIKNNH